MTHYWSYEGPVTEYGEVITRVWKANTWADTERKARSNFAYQYKQQFNKILRTKITLPGKITMIA